MSPQHTLDRICAFAASAHTAQKRKYSDEPYINHLVRVMDTCRQYTGDIRVLAAAVLHDILEDTTVTEEQLGEFLQSVMEPGVAEDTQSLVVQLTDVYIKKNFPSMNRRTRRHREAERLARVSPDAQTIKYADILDNINDLVGGDDDFAPVFLRECRAILQRMNQGNQLLYQRTVQAVDENLQAYYRNANIRAL